MSDNYENLGNGRRVVRGPDGTFKKAVLDSETAAEMGRKPKENRGETGKSSGSLLQEAGYPDPDQAPEHMRLLADIAASKRSGSVMALRDFRRLTIGDDDNQAERVQLDPGERCPSCGQPYVPMGYEAAGRILRLLNE